jgi:DNA primase small subunit
MDEEKQQGDLNDEFRVQQDFLLNREKLLKQYYQDMFPFDRIARWLAYDDWKGNPDFNEYFNRREISYNMAVDEDNEYVIRHLCYANPENWKKEVLAKVPIRIDIGAVFDQEPRKNKDSISREKSLALDREYVIDIDMSDYDRIRSCCSGKKLCQRCWKFMYVAYKVLKKALKEDFGFENVLWVFSGRRGIHAWISDERARIMRNEVRAAITDYLDISISADQADSLVKRQVRDQIGDDGTFNYPAFE